MFVIMMFRNFVPTYLADAYKYTTFEIGVLGSILFASSAVLGILLGRLGDVKGKSYPLAIALILSAAAMVLMMLTGNFGILAVSFAFYGGSYIIWSMLSAVVGPTAPESSRARWIAVPQTFSMFASFAAPYVGGLLYSASTRYPFIIATIALLILAFLSIRILKE
jgi:MFS family permease